MSEPALKPCPFCGGEAVCMPDDWGLTYRISCRCCRVGTFSGTDREVTAVWNRRVEPVPTTGDDA